MSDKKEKDSKVKSSKAFKEGWRYPGRLWTKGRCAEIRY